MQRILEKDIHRRMLHHAAEVDYQNIMTDLRYNPEIVRNEKDRHPELFLQLLQEFKDLGLNGDVQSRSGLVRDQ